MKGNPIRLILLLIRLFYPFEKRKEKEKKKRGKEKQFPHNEKRTQRETTRRQIGKPLNLDFDNRTKIEPVIKRFISSHIVHIEQFRTPTTTDTQRFEPLPCSGKRDEERK